MLNCAIGIVLYRRPKYTKMLFDALKLNQYVDQFPIYISIDFYNYECSRELLAIIESNKRFLNIVDVRFHNSKIGCGYNQFYLMDMIREDDFIIFEDDAIPLAYDSLNYFYSHFPQLKEQNLFSICGYNFGGNKDQPHGFVTKNYFCPWGFAMTKTKWQEIKHSVFNDGKVVPYEHSWQKHGAWDTAILKNVENRNTIYPTLSRIQNVGAELTTFVPSAEWHAANHHVVLGAWSIEIQKKELGKWKD